MFLTVEAAAVDDNDDDVMMRCNSDWLDGPMSACLRSFLTADRHNTRSSGAITMLSATDD